MQNFVALALMGAASAMVMTEQDFDFIQYIAKHNKNYKSVEEYIMRKANFDALTVEINHLNSIQSSSVHGHNKFSDWTKAEYESILGLKNMPEPTVDPKSFAPLTNAPIANDINWVTAGKVVPVKDQAQCGSCWAFATTASTESSWAIDYNLSTTNNTIISISEQQLVSCSSSFGNQGCNGGWYYYAWQYLLTTPDMTEAAYPYTSATGTVAACAYQAGQGVVNTVANSSGAYYVSAAGNTAAVQAALNVKPNAIAVHAASAVFQSYTSGVITQGSNCGTVVDHAITAVGYGTDPTYGGYFLVQNSWGTSWGDNGYVKLGYSTTAAGVCGMYKNVAYPLTI